MGSYSCLILIGAHSFDSRIFSSTQQASLGISSAGDYSFTVGASSILHLLSRSRCYDGLEAVASLGMRMHVPVHHIARSLSHVDHRPRVQLHLRSLCDGGTVNHNVAFCATMRFEGKTSVSRVGTLIDGEAGLSRLPLQGEQLVFVSI